MMKSRLLLFTALLLFIGVSLHVSAQPKDAANLNWKKEIPQAIHPDTDLVNLYYKTWEIAADRVRKGPEGLPASPYLDENCYEDQIWIWDACFMVMFSKYAPAAYPGKETLDNLYYPIHENKVSPLRVHLRDNPPLFAWTEHDNFIFSADRKHLNKVLLEKKYLQRHFVYFDTIPFGNIQEAISPNPIVRNVVKDQTGKIIGYTWSGGGSGMDNTPRGRDAGGYRKIMWIDAISQQALSALHITRLFELIGDKKEAKVWRTKYNEIKKTINQHYWDEQDGYYYDTTVADGTPCRIKTPASFWAMLAEVPSQKQANRMVEYLKKEEFMGGKYPWTSVSRDDKDHDSITGNYWRGGVWIPIVYMGTKALEKYGYYQLADELAEKAVRHQLRTYHAITPHTIWECYNPSKDEPSIESGRQVRQDFCGWSALGPISLFIENIMGFRSINALTQTVEWNMKQQNGTHGLRNLKFGNTIVDLVYHSDNKSVEIKTNKPFTVIINGTSYSIKKGETTLSIQAK